MNDFSESQKHLNSRVSYPVLIICNGHGEDVIAFEIIKKLLSLKQVLRIEILSLVGQGNIFDSIISEKIEKIGYRRILPSGGFSNQSLKGLFQDLKAGLLIDLLRNWLEVRRKSKEYKLIAIGDLLPLFFAWSSQCNFGFIGTPKSDYTWMSGPGSSVHDFYHKIKGSEWDPWEIYLMNSYACKFVLLRDEITAKNLKKKKVDA